MTDIFEFHVVPKTSYGTGTETPRPASCITQHERKAIRIALSYHCCRRHAYLESLGGVIHTGDHLVQVGRCPYEYSPSPLFWHCFLFLSANCCSFAKYMIILTKFSQTFYYKINLVTHSCAGVSLMLHFEHHSLIGEILEHVKGGNYDMRPIVFGPAQMQYFNTILGCQHFKLQTTCKMLQIFDVS